MVGYNLVNPSTCTVSIHGRYLLVRSTCINEENSFLETTALCKLAPLRKSFTSKVFQALLNAGASSDCVLPFSQSLLKYFKFLWTNLTSSQTFRGFFNIPWIFRLKNGFYMVRKWIIRRRLKTASLAPVPPSLPCRNTCSSSGGKNAKLVRHGFAHSRRMIHTGCVVHCVCCTKSPSFAPRVSEEMSCAAHAQIVREQWLTCTRSKSSHWVLPSTFGYCPEMTESLSITGTSSAGSM